MYNIYIYIFSLSSSLVTAKLFCDDSFEPLAILSSI